MAGKLYSFEGDMKGTVTKSKRRKNYDLGDNLNGGSLDNYFILPEDEAVYLSLLPAPSLTQFKAGIGGGGSAMPVSAAAAAAAGGSAPAPAPAPSIPSLAQTPSPAVTPSLAPSTAPALPSTSQVDAMDCATMQTTLDAINSNSAYYTANRQGVQYQQIAKYLNQKILACSGTPASPNPKPPVISVSGSQNITLPQNSVTIDASGTFDPDGEQLSFLWNLVSGPSAPVITGANASVASFSNLVQGNYIFGLTVTNTSGLSSTQNVNVSVAAAPAGTPSDTGAGTAILGNAPVTIATTAPVSLDSVSPYSSDPGIGGGGGGAGGGSDTSSTDTGSSDTIVAGVILPMWAQWLAVGLIIAGTVYILSGKDE